LWIFNNKFLFVKINQLCEYGAIKNIHDLFKLNTKAEAIKTIPGWQDKKLDK
jgi:hypothetical protein